MGLKRPNRQIIWPSNMDSTKTRLQGRKIPLPRAIRQPSLKEVVEAARALELDPQPTEKAAKPGTTWDKTGYIEIKKTGSNIQTLTGIAGEVAKIHHRQLPHTPITAKKRCVARSP